MSDSGRDDFGGFAPPSAQGSPPIAPAPVFSHQPPSGPHPAADFGEREIGGRARMAEVAIWGCAAASVLYGIVNLVWALRIGARLDGKDVSDAALDSWENATYVFAFFVFVGLIVGAVFFIRWQLAAWRAARTMGAAGMRYSEGWNIGAWFIPIANVWIPKQLINDIWRGTATDARHPDSQSGNLPGLLLGWWLAYLFLNGAGFVGPFDPKTLEDDQITAWAAAIGGPLMIIPAWLATKVLRAFTARVEARAEAVRTDGRSTVV